MSQANQQQQKPLRSKIAGVGAYHPEICWKNDDLKDMLDTSDEWIRQRTGIEQRYWVDPNSGETTSDLGKRAAEIAIADAGLTKQDIDFIIFATISGDHEFPGTGCFMQAKMEMPGVPTLDIKQQCTGFIYAMSIADQYIRSGMYKNILVVGAETHSKGLDRTPAGRDVAVLFGDGAGAVVVSANEVENEAEGSQVLSSHLYSDGQYAQDLWVPAPGMAYKEGFRITKEMIDNKLVMPSMNGKTVFVHASKRMSQVVVEALEKNQRTTDDVDLFLFHQANLRINEMVAKQLKINEDKVFNTIQKYANTTAATIPIGMFEAKKAGRLKRGDLVCCAAFGSGFTWGSLLLRY